MPTRPVNGVTLSYGDRGDGAPPLVLLHGFPLDNRVWDAQRADLSSRWRVVAPDLRGFGQSASADTDFTIESFADDVHALLASTGALPCVLGGLSMGGYVALAYARKYPADLRGLVLVDTKAEADTAEAKAGREKMADLARTAGAKAVADQMMPKMLAPDTPEERPEVAERLREIMESCPPATIARALRAMRDRPDRTAELSSVRVPALVVVGEADAITPVAQAEAMRNQLPDATVAVIRGAGHMTPMEQPGQVNEALREFMERVGRN